VSTQGQGPLNDPRLVERRGDLSGLNALLFVILVVVGFLAAAFLLYSLTKGSPTASSSPSPSPVLSRAPSPTVSNRPSLSASPSALATVSASLPITVPVGTPASVIVDGQLAGQATVLSAQYSRSLQGKTAPAGMRWLLVSVRLTATATMAYDENFWSALDTSGASHGWRGSDPSPSLGSGTLNLGETRTGNVTFQVPNKPGIASLVLEADDGSQLVVVSLP
jgi:hypothetical protein